MKEDKTEKERIASEIQKREIRLRDYDGEYEHPTKYTSGKANYVERNRAMIDDSDFCVFYYDAAYLPPRRKRAVKDLFDFQPKSGTAVAYAYARQKKKAVLNLCDGQNAEEFDKMSTAPHL